MLRSWQFFPRATDAGSERKLAITDLLVVNGDLLEDLGLFQDQGKHLAVIMKDGKFFMRTLC